MAIDIQAAFREAAAADHQPRRSAEAVAPGIGREGRIDAVLHAAGASFAGPMARV